MAHVSDAPWDPYHYERRRTRVVTIGDLTLGGSSTVAVFASIDDAHERTAMARILRWASPAGKRQPKPDGAVVAIRDINDLVIFQRIAERLEKWPQAKLALIAAGDDPALLMDALPHADAVMARTEAISAMLLAMAACDAGKPLIFEDEVVNAANMGEVVDGLLQSARDARECEADVILSFQAPESERIHAYRLLAAGAAEMGIDAPILLHTPASPVPLLPESIALGSPLCDGFGDAVLISGMEDSTTLTFNILQAAGARITKTDYVACPSCGRTLFDLQETTDRIKQRTSHLVGVRLAIMGCIVNGPGEMADADFGYVGGAPGQVNLYVGKECVEKGVPAEIADDRLIELIKAHGKWQEEDD